MPQMTKNLPLLDFEGLLEESLSLEQVKKSHLKSKKAKAKAKAEQLGGPNVVQNTLRKN